MRTAQTNDITHSRTRKILIVFIILFGFLTLLFYFTQRPLWLDEGYVFESIRDFSYGEIFGPLKADQAFPRVHLALIKFISTPFDFHLLSLRFLSLIFMFSAFLVWIRLYKITLKNEWLVLLCVMSFVCAVRINYYAAELKPYSMDVFVVGLYCWFFHYQKQFVDKPPTRKLYALIMLMPLLIFFSYAGIFVVWMIGFNLLLMIKNNRSLIKPLLINAVVTLICLFVNYQICLKYSAHIGNLQLYWKGSFVDVDTFVHFTASIWEGTRRIVTFWYGNTDTFKRVASAWIPFFYYAVFVYGFRLWKRDQFRIFSVGSMGAVLYAELFVFGLFHKYPFTGERVTLFLAPFVFYLIVCGLDDLKKIKKFKWPYYGFMGFYIAFLLACLVNTFFSSFKLLLDNFHPYSLYKNWG